MSGFVRDANTKEALIGACISNLQTGAVSFTNHAGFFSLPLSHDSVIDVSFSYSGYHSFRWQGSIADTLTKQIYLKAKDNILGTVEVSATRAQREKTELSTLSMPIKQIKALPSITGESDIMRSFQLMPGVQGGKEASSGIYVRGGSPDQNLFLLDGVELYNVNHIGGFLSTFDANAINSVKLYKGGFPARYGGRLSSVMDLTMKDGNKKEWKRNVLVGSLSSKLSIEGPLSPDTSSIFISLRRCNVDLFTRPAALLDSEGETMTGYTFYDLYAKYNTILGSKGRFSFSIYNGRDKIFISMHDKAKQTHETDLKAKDHIKWGNTALAAQYTHLFTPKVFARFVAAYTVYSYQRLIDVKWRDYGQSSYDNTSLYSLNSGVRDVSLQSEIEIFASAKHTLSTGTSIVAHMFKPGDTKSNGLFTTYDTKSAPHIPAIESSLFLQDKWDISENIALNIGLRGNMYAVQNTLFNTLQPRLNVHYRFYKDYALKASYTEMSQATHLVSAHNAALPSDIWLPATKLLAPEHAKQYTIGIFKDFNFRGHTIDISIETYYKRLSHLIDYQEGVSFFSHSSTWEKHTEPQGKADIYGIEFLMQKQTGRTTGLLSYTWSKNTRQFEHINHGNPFPYQYDRRHDISIAVIHQIDDHISFSASWVYNTGTAITLAKAHYQNMFDNYYGQPAEVHIYGGKNAYRMPAFHKLDLSVSFSKQKKKGIRTWTIGVYNAYAHQNAFFVYYKEDNGKSTLYQYCLFPFLPSVSYSFKF